MHNLYRLIVPFEARYWIYKLRKSRHFKQLRYRVMSTPKGKFSLAPFDQNHAIFVHITKTAGTSVAMSLFGQLPEHHTAVQYRVIFGRRTFNSYFKFAFVRNPWERLYSAYSYLKQGGWCKYDDDWAQKELGHIRDFNEFVTGWLTSERLDSHIHLWPQSRFICNHRHKPIIDYLAYFENISDDFEYIRNHLGINAELQHINTSKRESYKDIYNDEAIHKVHTLYSRDIENFGYIFDGYTRKVIVSNKFCDAE